MSTGPNTRPNLPTPKGCGVVAVEPPERERDTLRERRSYEEEVAGERRLDKEARGEQGHGDEGRELIGLRHQVSSPPISLKSSQ